MKFENLAILLTCHSLEDFPVHHDGEEADSLLANWTALWHPQLIANAGKIPTWIRTYEVPENCENYLFLCPITSDSELQTGFAQRVKEENGRLIRRKTCRDDILTAVFEESAPPTVDAETVKDFFALGYCFLQIQLLTRQLRYSSNLDEVYFASLVTDAADAAVAGNADTTQQKLQSAFDLLMEERDNFYPVNALLIDLTLVAETTLGASLAGQLTDTPIHCNYLISASTAKELAKNSELKQAMVTAIESKQASVVGGCLTESRLPLLSMESILNEFQEGRKVYEETLGAQVDFFGRRRYGLTTFLPQVLEHFDFKGAFHFTLDDGRFPEGMQIKSYWEGDGDARIEVFGKVPLDANASGNFLNLGVKIGESFDMDHAAAICFVHWPGQTSIWYEDLKRICRFGSVLGKFVSAKEFLEEMEEPYQHDRFTPDQYQSPYFKQAVIRNQVDPISSSVRYWKRTLLFDSIKTLDFLNGLFSNATQPTEVAFSHRELIEWYEGQTEDDSSDPSQVLADQEQQVARRLVQSMSKTETESPSEVVLNTSSLVHRSSVTIPAEISPSIEKPIYASTEIPNSDTRHVVVDVPSMGYASVVSGSPSPQRRKQQLLVDEMVLRNDFMEVVLDQTTGGIRAVHDYKSRGNRMSQVLGYRCKSKSDADKFLYSTMKLNSFDVVENTTSTGRVRTAGQLLFDGEPVADYVQEFSLYKGSRVLQVDVEWSNVEPPKSDPWNWYFGSRFAFGDESSLMSTTLNQSRQPVSGNRIEAPHYIDLETLKTRTSILTGGVPFHIRRGDRYIDSIHIVKGETGRQFSFGIGVDLPNPLHHANALLKPAISISSQHPIQPAFSWLFHFDSKNVLATSWEPVVEADKTVGFRVRILETMARETKFKLSSFKTIQSAQQIRIDGQAVTELPVKEGKIEISLAPNQFIELEARW